MTQRLFFAVGDVHGHLSKLRDLHAQIDAYMDAAHPQAHLTYVMLGDLIDRGPESAGVIDYVMGLAQTETRACISLRGNHEQGMVDSFSGKKDGYRRQWLKWGGVETLESYEARGELHPPKAHLKWLAACPAWHWDRPQGLVFVHGGIDPKRFPDCGDEIRMWTRAAEFMDTTKWAAPDLANLTVVHGHTPTSNNRADISFCGRRINVDTGAGYGGPVTGVLLGAGRPQVFQAS